jgi:serine phosphatase RsbU (regulator of sigma subunit)
MSTAANSRPALMPWQDPVQATIPEIRDGSMSAVYYGQRCSGDFYDFVRVNPQRVLFGLFDVAGLLQQTRRIVLALQQQFRESGTLLFEPGDANESESMLQLWLNINNIVMKSASGVHPCPAFMACYNEELGTLCYVNAGHTPGLVRDRREIQELKATALPLGLFSHSVPDSSVLALQPGNALLIVSKGVLEAKHDGEEYGIELVNQYLRDAACETAHETCVGILSKVQQFMGTAPTHNDVTALALVRSN